VNLPVVEANSPADRVSDKDPRRHLLDLTGDQLREWLREQGQPAFRATQILDWVFTRRVVDFERMTNLPGGLRSELDATFRVFVSQVA
jgi:23S rRNA (adenine2503-C2)-methyltransferase